MKNILKFLLPLVLLCLAVIPSAAQFQNKAFSQNYSTGADSLGRDSTDKLFSFKEYFRGVRHKDEARIGVLFGGSFAFLGGMQMYNKEYWKLPIVYGGMAATGGLGLYYRIRWAQTSEQKYKTTSDLLFAGTWLLYWGQLMDGVINYPSKEEHSPGKATLYSVLLPGLGQAYNGEYWKIPIYYTCMAGAGYFLATNHSNYIRYKRIYNEATTPGSGYSGQISASAAKYYRDSYRRFRDYSVVALAGFYLLQVIDANVFSYMRGFEVGDEITMKFQPTILAPDNAYALAPGTAGVGMRLGITF